MKMSAFALAAVMAACTIPSTNANAKPFTQPAGYTGGLWEVGTGPDRLELDVSNNPSTGCCNDIAIRVTPDGGTPTIVAAPIHVHSLAGAGVAGNDSYVFHGVFGTAPKVEFFPVAPGGMGGLWVNNVSINYNPLVSNSCNDSRGGCAVNAPGVFDSAGTPITYGPPVVVAPPRPAQIAPPARQPSVISGATINGEAHDPATLANLVSATPAGGTLRLPAGILSGTAAVPSAITITGAGMGKTIIDGSGIQPIYAKGGFVPLVSGVVFQDLTIRNFTIPESLGGNAAGVRDNGDGIGFTLNRVELAHNQNGILTYSSSITLSNDNFHDNGTGSGRTHNFYVNGNPSSVLTITNTKSSSPVGGHAAKSRAGKTNITGGTFTAGGDGAALDIPDGGAVNLDGLTLIQPGTGTTHNILAFAMESAKNAASGMVIHAKGLKIVDPAGVAIIVCANGGSLVLAEKNNTYQGPKAGPDIRGCAVTGSFTKAK
jgi:hypothetical protein